jgi:hypothetical protein
MSLPTAEGVQTEHLAGLALLLHALGLASAWGLSQMAKVIADVVHAEPPPHGWTLTT